MRSLTYRAAMTAAAAAALSAAVIASGPGRAQDEGGAPDPANWREVAPDRLLMLDTTKGRILIETAPEFAPNHVARFTLLARTGFYEGVIFHRVIDDFMVQGGSGSTIDAEFFIERDASLPVVEISERQVNRGGFWHGMPVVTQPIAQAAIRADGKVESWISHCAGTVSTARSEDPNSADSQFFIMRYSARADGAPNTFLDRSYTAWGHVVDGLDVVRAMNIGTVGENPGFEPDSIVAFRVVADLPEAERPRVFVMREDGSALSEIVDSMTEDAGRPPDVCDVTVPTQVIEP